MSVALPRDCSPPQCPQNLCQNSCRHTELHAACPAALSHSTLSELITVNNNFTNITVSRSRTAPFAYVNSLVKVASCRTETQGFYYFIIFEDIFLFSGIFRQQTGFTAQKKKNPYLPSQSWSSPSCWSCCMSTGNIRITAAYFCHCPYSFQIVHITK